MQGRVDQYVTWKPISRELNPRPVNRKSNALPLSHHVGLHTNIKSLQRSPFEHFHKSRRINSELILANHRHAHQEFHCVMLAIVMRMDLRAYWWTDDRMFTLCHALWYETCGAATEMRPRLPTTEVGKNPITNANDCIPLNPPSRCPLLLYLTIHPSVIYDRGPAHTHARNTHTHKRAFCASGQGQILLRLHGQWRSHQSFLWTQNAVITKNVPAMTVSMSPTTAIQ